MAIAHARIAQLDVITTHVDANFTSDELLQELSSVSDSDSVLFDYLCHFANFSFVIPYISH